MTNTSSVRNFSTNRTEKGYWPHNVSHEPTMTIGEVRDLLAKEFPSVTLSKIRHWNEKGIVNPSRSEGGFRKFSQADYQRLRYAISAQRDSFLPLDIILSNLEMLDLGKKIEEVSKVKVISRDGNTVLPSVEYITTRELLDYTGLEKDELDEMVKYGFLQTDVVGRFRVSSIKIVGFIKELTRAGVDIRKLRPLFIASLNFADSIDRVTSHIRTNKSSIAKERCANRAHELGDLIVRLQSELLHDQIERLQ
ncbi:MerR family transcriptional regulator [Actinomyces sp. zg-332]|uniref:transcriptional regulator FtsR n=1 Tax=Actinomyces sp. zg-332 TaxID=2708340 RepID=UPI001421A20F|nr:MerR family transcriptional regulator [Actinomyces sp. zg-332]QPK94696.1 MerR family transcriptional regulator [Actinomyces sp. zg-332]